MTCRVSHHTQALDVIKDLTATSNIPRGTFIGKPVRILFHKIPIPSSQTTVPLRGMCRVISKGQAGHTNGQNMVAQVSVKSLIKGGPSRIRANVTIHTK